MGTLTVPAAECHVNMLSSLGDLGRLPREVRDMIYGLILVSSHARNSFGRGSNIQIAILAASVVVHHEASQVLYQAFSRPGGHVIGNAASGQARTIPRAALLKLPELTFELAFKSLNRGECEQEIVDFEKLQIYAESIALTLLHSPALVRLHVELLNINQRKRGRRLVRSQTIKDQIRRLLELFAYLDRRVIVAVGGFDTIEYVDMWHEIRELHQGQDVPFTSMLPDILLESSWRKQGSKEGGKAVR